MASVLARLTWGVAAVLLVAAPAQAEFEVSRITEEEAANYLKMIDFALRSCSADWLVDHFAPGAAVYMTHADGSQEILSPFEYNESIKAYCQPYQAIRWDRKNLRVASGAFVTTVTWNLAWGGAEEGQQGAPKIMFENWADLVKEGARIRIARAGWTAYEYVPGAEEEFAIRTSEGNAAYKIRVFVRDMADGAVRVYEHFARRFQPKPGPQQRADRTEDVFE